MNQTRRRLAARPRARSRLLKVNQGIGLGRRDEGGLSAGSWAGGEQRGSMDVDRPTAGACECFSISQRVGRGKSCYFQIWAWPTRGNHFFIRDGGREKERWTGIEVDADHANVSMFQCFTCSDRFSRLVERIPVASVRKQALRLAFLRTFWDMSVAKKGSTEQIRRGARRGRASPKNASGERA
jgi:hypothetical protein